MKKVKVFTQQGDDVSTRLLVGEVDYNTPISEVAYHVDIPTENLLQTLIIKHLGEQAWVLKMNPVNHARTAVQVARKEIVEKLNEHLKAQKANEELDPNELAILHNEVNRVRCFLGFPSTKLSEIN